MAMGVGVGVDYDGEYARGPADRSLIFFDVASPRRRGDGATPPGESRSDSRKKVGSIGLSGVIFAVVAVAGGFAPATKRDRSAWGWESGWAVALAL